MSPPKQPQQNKNARLHICSVCQKSFKQSEDLTRHERTHSGERPYKCNVCPDAFTQKANLIRHMKKHSGEKPYVCDICTKPFALRNNLKIHMRTHSGEKPYACNQCEQAFARNGDLTRHMRIHSGVEPYECRVCKQKFTKINNLTRHMRTHTGAKPYVCSVCKRAFTESTHLDRHMMALHPSQHIINKELKGLMADASNKFHTSDPAANFLSSLPPGQPAINRELHGLMSDPASQFGASHQADTFLRSVLSRPSPPQHIDTAPTQASEMGRVVSSQSTLSNVINALRTLGNWNGQHGDLVPWLLSRLPSWPGNRILTIHTYGNNPVIYSAPGWEYASGVSLNLLLNVQHYELLIPTPGTNEFQRILTPPDGDCFYHAVLNGLSLAERSALLGYPSSGNVTVEDIIQLRQLLADYILTHPDEVLPFLTLHP
jgi:DNA-directed RNA polymerase subunit RPC12/RpoP